MVGLIGLACCTPTHHQKHKLQADQQWRQVRARVKLQLAAQQYEGGLFDDCSKTAGEAVSLDPACTEGYVLLSRSHLELGRTATAQKVLESARSAGLDSPDLSYTEGVILEHRQRRAEALEKYTAALSKSPEHLDSVVASAECLVALGRAPEAQALLREKLDHLDDDASLHILAAHVATLLDNDGEALQHLEAARLAAGQDRQVAEDLGLFLVRLSRCDQAIPLLLPSRNEGAQPELSLSARRGLAECYLAANDFASARVILAPFVDAHADDAMAQLLLAKSAIALGDGPAARRCIEAAQRQQPNHPEVLLVRAVVDYQQGRLADAKNSLEQVLAIRPDDQDARSVLDQILQSK